MQYSTNTLILPEESQVVRQMWDLRHVVSPVSRSLECELEVGESRVHIVVFVEDLAWLRDVGLEAGLKLEKLMKMVEDCIRV